MLCLTLFSCFKDCFQVYLGNNKTKQKNPNHFPQLDVKSREYPELSPGPKAAQSANLSMCRKDVTLMHSLIKRDSRIWAENLDELNKSTKKEEITF